MKIADIFASLTLKDDQFNRGLDRAHQKSTSFANVLQGVFQGMGQRLFDGIVRGAGFFIDKMGEAVTASSNLNEVMNKTNATFGSAAAGVENISYGVWSIATGRARCDQRSRQYVHSAWIGAQRSRFAESGHG